MTPSKTSLDTQERKTQLEMKRTYIVIDVFLDLPFIAITYNKKSKIVTNVVHNV